MAGRRYRIGGAVLSVLFCLISVGLLTGLRIADPYPVRTMRETGFDLLQRLSPREYVQSPVRIVDIDEASLSRFGQWPWPRHLLADMVDRLHAAGAATIVFDMLFAEPDRLSPSRLLDDPRLKSLLGEDGSPDQVIPDNDVALAQAIGRGPVVLGFAESERPGPAPPAKAGYAYTGADPAARVPRIRGAAKLVPILADAAAGLGSVNISRTRSLATVRRVPLLWSDVDGSLYPSLAAEALRVAQGAQTYVVHADAETGRVQSLRIGALEVPTEPTGELIIHYTTPRDDRFISAVQIFDDRQLRTRVPDLQGHIVLIGTSATGLFDIRTNALGYRTAGVEIHAQAIEQILNAQFIHRHDWTQGLEILAMIIASLIIVLTTLYGSARLALFFGGCVAVVITVSTWLSFIHRGVLLDASFPLLAGLCVWFVAIAVRYLMADREKRAILGAFSHYVHPSILRQIERSHRDVRLGGENRLLTVMFSDVRNFTSLSERMEPEVVINFLNLLLGRLATEIANESGVLDKFIGDSVMAFWNAPLHQPDHPSLACAAALRMRTALAEMNASRDFQLPQDNAPTSGIRIGIGINTGTACVGNVGSIDRFNYSAVGDAVNVAARAEAASKDVGYDIVVTSSTADAATDFALIDAGDLAFRGKAEKVPVKILVGGPDLRASARYSDFSRHYDDLIAALCDGRSQTADDAMAVCRRLAPEIEPGLLRYLDRLPERVQDFRQPPPKISMATGLAS